MDNGANFVVSVLHDHLSMLKEQTEASHWPHTVFLQVDNCWRENKNTTMIITGKENCNLLWLFLTLFNGLILPLILVQPSRWFNTVMISKIGSKGMESL